MKSEDYIFESVLGRGIFGTVHLVRRKSNLQPYVIKEQTLSATSLLSFQIVLREIESMRQLRHPNIVAYHGAWLEGNRSYIVMEFARHGTLKDLLESRQLPLKEEDALYLFTQVVLGVQHIHSKDILHRDLKPENIMLTGRNADQVKIVDFGLSKNSYEETLCHVGTFSYMAPEILKREMYDYKADIWSMGVVLYEMVTKRLPFPARTYTELVEMVIREDPQPVEQGLSNEVVSLISKMLRKQAIFRPSTGHLIVSPCLKEMKTKIYLNIGCLRIGSLRDVDLVQEHVLNFLKPSAGPSSAEPSSAEPSSDDLSSAGPSSAEPSSAEPSSAGPSSADLSSAGPSSAEPSSADPSPAGPSSADPSSADLSSAEPSSANWTIGSLPKIESVEEYVFDLLKSSAKPSSPEPSFADWTIGSLPNIDFVQEHILNYLKPSAEPSSAEPSSADPSSAEPLSAGPSSADLSSAGPSSAGPLSADPSSADPSSAEPSSADPSSADLSSAGPSSAGPSSAGSSSAGSSFVEPSSADRSFTDWTIGSLPKIESMEEYVRNLLKPSAEPSSADLSSAGPSSADPSSADPSSVEPSADRSIDDWTII